jgi:cytochrome c peroxidase
VRGLTLFQKKGRCINCHGGPELTNASYTSVLNHRIERMAMGDGKKAVYDNGFYNIGVRPTSEDLGLGAEDGLGRPLSEARLASMGLLRDPTLSPQVGRGERVAADGAFKTPGLRNVELTAPYMHNGGQGTLMQVVDFYNRGGDRTGSDARDSTGFGVNGTNLDTDIVGLGLTAGEKSDLVAFLRALTDERVRHRGAPFDHPQLFVPNGHPWDMPYQGEVVEDPGTGDAEDALVEIPAVGRSGGTPLATFGQNLAPSR